MNRVRSGRVFVGALLLVLSGAAPPLPLHEALAHTCGGPCPTPAPAGTMPPECTADCTEDDIRKAVAAVNSCGGNRVISIAGASCTGSPTTIAMKQQGGPVLGTCVGGSGACGTTGGTCSLDSSVRCGCNADCHASCGSSGDGVGNAVCLRGSRMTIDGHNRVRFKYSRPTVLTHPLDGACCRDQCGTQPFQSALFALNGNENTVKNFEMEYFPEGIHIRTGSGHEVSGVRSERICDDAVSVDAGAGSGHRILFNGFAARQMPDAGEQECWVECCGTASCGTVDTGCVLGQPGQAAEPQPTVTPIAAHWKQGVCGRDKVMQLNGGSVEVRQNRIDTPSNGIQIRGGTHTFRRNTTTGDPGTPNACQAYIVGPATTGPITASFVDNAVSSCRHGIDLRPDAHSVTVTADGNAFLGNSASAFHLSSNPNPGTASLSGYGNVMTKVGLSTTSPRGALLIEDADNTVMLRASSFCRGTASPPDIRCTGTSCGQVEIADSCFRPAPRVVDPSNATGLAVTGATECTTEVCVPPPSTVCAAAPLTTCRPSDSQRPKAHLVVEMRGGAKNKLRWDWGMGAATTLADYGDPRSSRSYALCVYSAGTLVIEAIAPAGGICSPSGAPCWKELGSGWYYFDRSNPTPDGIGILSLSPGTAGRAKHRVRAGGLNLELPPSLVMTAPVTVQLQSNEANAPCWGTTFAASEFRRNQTNKFDAFQ